MENKTWQSSIMRLFVIAFLLLMAVGPSSSVLAGTGSLLQSTTPASPRPAGPETDATLTFTAITSGMEHTCGLTPGGGVKCWGSNGVHQIGDGTYYPNRSFPKDVFGLDSGVKAIAAGETHTCAIMLSDGSVQCWGDASGGVQKLNR